MTAVLLDTCALIWLGFGDESLSLVAKQRIEESEIVYVSPVSLWEISNKYRQGKIELPQVPREWFKNVRARHRLTTLPLTNEIMIAAGELPEHHKDPADRMIIASALDAGLEVVTGDHNFPLYGVKTIK